MESGVEDAEDETAAEHPDGHGNLQVAQRTEIALVYRGRDDSQIGKIDAGAGPDDGGEGNQDQDGAMGFGVGETFGNLFGNSGE